MQSPEKSIFQILYERPLIRTAILFIAVFACTFLYLEKKYPLREYGSCVYKGGADIDMYEYHFLAVNMYAEGKFPVLGFLRPESYYKFCPNPQGDVQMSDIYLAIYRKAGPVTVTIRPPVYPFLLAGIYTVFGYDLTYALWLNFFILSLIIAFMVTGSCMLYGKWGWLWGVTSGYLFLHYSPYNIYELKPDFVLVLFTLLFFLTIVLASRNKSLLGYFLAGVFYALALLTKGLLMPLGVILIAAIFWGERNFVAASKKSLGLLVGMFLLLSPWIYFINKVNVETKGERDHWKQVLNEMYPLTRDADGPDVFTKDTEAKTNGLKNLISYAYNYYMETPSFITHTGVVVPGVFRRYHNEYCTDGDIHLEYFLFKNSFYNTIDPNTPQSQQIFLFYKTHPALLFKIALAKLQLAFLPKKYPFIVWSVLASMILMLFSQPVVKNQKLLARLFWVFVILSIAGLLSPIMNDIVLLTAAISPLMVVLFMGRLTYIMEFLVFIAFWCAMLIVTLIFNGDLTYVGIIEPICIMVLIGSLYGIINRIYNGRTIAA